MADEYDIAVIGGGPGGYVAAIRAAQLDAKVALVEADALGGTCLNRGCIPSKVLLHAASIFSSIRKGVETGLSAEANLEYPQLAERKETVVGRLNKGLQGLMKARKIEVIPGCGKLTGKRQVTVTGADGETVLDVPKIILATGSEPARPGAFPFDGEKVITSDEALRWQQPPASLLIVGGGATGCEFASAMSDFGVEVHIVEMLPQLLPFADPDIALDLQRAFKKRGIKTHTSTKIESMTAAQNVVADLGDQQIEAEVALVCAGRKMNTGGLGLEELGIEMEDSSIQINDHCQTSQESIYAIGDITGKVLLAHVASRQGTVAAEHAMGANTSMDYAAIPGCVFTDPEVAFAGMTREAAEAEGRNVKEAKFPFQMLGKSQVVGELTGFLKMIGDAQTNQVLGVHIIGPHATELIGEGVLAIRLEATVEDLAETVHAHPTFSEAYLEAAELYLGHPIHGRG